MGRKIVNKNKCKLKGGNEHSGQDLDEEAIGYRETPLSKMLACVCICVCACVRARVSVCCQYIYSCVYMCVCVYIYFKPYKSLRG